MPIKTRAEKIDDQLGRIEVELLAVKTKVEIGDRRIGKIESSQAVNGTRHPWGVVEIVSKGNLASRMFQYMTALSIVELAGGGRIAGANLPEWQMEPTTIPSDGQQATRDNGQWVPVQRLSRLLQDCLVERVILEGACHNVNNLLPPERYRDVFSVDPNLGRQTDARSLLIVIRGDATMDAAQEDDVLVPVQFYADVIAETGLRPVFMGQLSPSPYMDAIRARFPDAAYWESVGGLADFATILKAKNIVVSISTFSWLAAWLSRATQIILPLSGMLNPFQNQSQNFVPAQDPRYRFYRFPINYAVPVAHYEPVHEALNGRWTPATADEIASLRTAMPTEPRKVTDYLAVFDEGYYLHHWQDVREGVVAGWLKSGRGHFSGSGFAENRRAFDLDHKFYSVAYPEAAEAIAQGKYLDFWHYHASVGHKMGNQLRQAI